ncbi:MAG TPA: YncE family protein [Kofleriaceae bacterium]|nr:YncE family protein [Kofleriaceae bacterium]
MLTPRATLLATARASLPLARGGIAAMVDPIVPYQRLTLALCTSLALLGGGCGTESHGTPPPPDTGGTQPPPPPPPPVFSTRVSRSSTIAISEDDSLVAMVNPDDGSLSVFKTSDNMRISRTPTGSNPSSVVIMGDGKTAYVANRGDGTVVRIVGIDGSTPTVDATVTVGAEPAGLALSPSGLKLFVAEFAESRVSVIDTATMTISTSILVDRPRSIVVTNNANQSDDDEQLLVAQFFGVPAPGGEVKDDGRTGKINAFPLTSLANPTTITLSPTAALSGSLATKTSPNQLAAMAVAGNRLYITSVSASPQGPARFDSNVYPVVYVADLSTGTEVQDASGTANLAQKVADLVPQPNPRFIPGDLSDIAFLDNSQVGYAVGRAGDVMLRLEYDSGLTVGTTQNAEIDLIGSAAIGSCQAPTGLVVSKKLGRGYVNCWVTRRLALVDFSTQTMTQTFESSPAPAGADVSVQKGKRFFFTGRARWSNAGANGIKGGEGWSSCGSCHADGLTDGITWAFGSGPRQTTSMDGTFSHSPGVGPQKQRILNWTAINDELHDFEANVRGVSGGLGAITSATNPSDCTGFVNEVAATLGAPLGASNKELADDPARASCGHKDWDDITNFVKTITPVHASKLADSQAITRGRALFVEGHCDNCHGGGGWTVSRRPYNPVGGGAVTLAPQTFTLSVFKSPIMYDTATGPRTQISNQPAITTADITGPVVNVEVPVLQLACALRNVGTYGIPGDDGATTSFEVRAGTPAEGRAGYNIPSLYGLRLGAPYLHHGQSPTLEDLFSNSKWKNHTGAGNPNFFLSLNEAGKRADLIAFLLSIDSSTAEFNIPASGTTSFDVCPGTPGQSE